MIYKLSNETVKDFANIYKYTLNTHGQIQAISYTESLKTCLENLANNPLLGKRYPYIREREIKQFVHKHYVIFYEINDSYILIVRILHQKSLIDILVIN